MTAPNPNSILDSVKQAIGLTPDNQAFDLDVTMFINAAIGALQQLGVGADGGFVISDNTTLWSQYTTQLSYLGMVKIYIIMSARLAFDPPGTSFGLDAIKNQLMELSWRINIAAEAANPPSDPQHSDDHDSQDGIMKSRFVPRVVYLPFASTVNIDSADGNVFYLTLTEDCTIDAPVNGEDGQHITLEVTSNGFSVTWGSGWNFGTVGVPSLSSGGRTDIISSVYRTEKTEWFAGYSPGF